MPCEYFDVKDEKGNIVGHGIGRVLNFPVLATRNPSPQ